MKRSPLRKYLQHLGYGSRREVDAMIADGRVTDLTGECIDSDVAFVHEQILVDGLSLDTAPGFLAMLHKPIGYVCSTRDAGRLIYDLLPSRWRGREPVVSPIGRLDRDTSGLLLLTDNGQLLHRIIHPRQHMPKVYLATLAEPLRGDEQAIFAAGDLMLDGESKPLASADLQIIDSHIAQLTITEGRYHQVRRMFAAVGNHVIALHRERIGGLSLADLPPGQWCLIDQQQQQVLFNSINQVQISK